MKSNPILEEAWRIKEQLAAQSGYDMDRFYEQLREWSETHPHPERIINTSEELRELTAEKGRQNDKNAAIILNDKPSPH